MKGKTKEGVGFFFEALCFFLAGALLKISIFFSFIIFFVGLFLAAIVGEQIKKNAREE